MTAVTPFKADLQTEELRTFAAISESTMQKLGADINFINNRYYGRANFDYLNYGNQEVFGTGINNGNGALCVFDFNAIIFNAWAYAVYANGQSAVISYDIKYVSNSFTAASGASIFYQKPSLNLAAATGSSPVYFGVNSATNSGLYTLPIFAKTFNTGASAATFSASAGGALIANVNIFGGGGGAGASGTSIFSGFAASGISALGIACHYLIAN
jgi:hypothetical protein